MLTTTTPFGRQLTRPVAARRAARLKPAAVDPHHHGQTFACFRSRSPDIQVQAVFARPFVAENHVVVDLGSACSRAPNSVAWRTPSIGVRLRRLPAQIAVGGAANGMPRNWRTPRPALLPSRVPVSTFTRSAATPEWPTRQQDPGPSGHVLMSWPLLYLNGLSACARLVY